MASGAELGRTAGTGKGRGTAHRPPGTLDRLGPLRADRDEHDRDPGMSSSAAT